MKDFLRKIEGLLLMLCCTVPLFAQQANLVNLSIEPITIKAGGTATVYVNMSNPEVDVASVILGVTLPKDFTFVQDKVWNEDDEEWNYFYASLTERKRSRFVLSERYAQDENTLHLTINGMGQVFKNSDGAIVTFKIKAAEDAVSGNMKVYKQSWSNGDASLGGECPDFYVTLTAEVPTGITYTYAEVDAKTLYSIDGKIIPKTQSKQGIYIINGNKKVFTK